MDSALVAIAGHGLSELALAFRMSMINVENMRGDVATFTVKPRSRPGLDRRSRERMWTLRRATRLRLASRLPLAATAPHHLLAARVCSKPSGPGPELITRHGTEDPRMSIAVVHKPSRTVSTALIEPWEGCI